MAGENVKIRAGKRYRFTLRNGLEATAMPITEKEVSWIRNLCLKNGILLNMTSEVPYVVIISPGGTKLHLVYWPAAPLEWLRNNLTDLRPLGVMAVILDGQVLQWPRWNFLEESLKNNCPPPVAALFK